MRRFRFLLALSAVGLLGCGGSDDATTPGPAGGGTTKGGASGAAGKAGSGGGDRAGAAGAGAAGAAAGASGAAGVGGAAGTAGAAAGQGGVAGQGTSGAGGQAGAAAAGSAGIGGAGGTTGGAGAAGVSGAAGVAGSGGQAGAGDACPSQVLCGATGVCCAVGDECASGACRPACASNVRCGETCCQSGAVCSQDACVVPGAACGDSFDCGEDASCEPTLGKCLPQPPGGPQCQYKPPVLPFAPKLEWSWTGSPIKPTYDQILSVPLVADVDADGTPDVVIVTHDTGDGACDTGHAYLRALDGKTGAEKWAATVDAYTDAARVAFCRTPALADLDGDGIPEIVAPRFGGGLLAVRGDGKLLWASTQADGTTPYTQYLTYAASVGIANVDGVGAPEIVLGGAVFDTQGKLLSGLGLQNIGGNPSLGAIALIADVDQDGKQDFVAGNAVYGTDGMAKWSIPASDGYTAIADFERDGVPELVVISNGFARVQNARTGQILASLDMPGNGAGGPPTIADFDGDGALDFASAVGDSYTIFTYRATPTPSIAVKWSVFTKDASSSRTGSSVFDFEGDGSAEVLYNDECYLRVYNGKNGDVLFETASSSGTASQYPIAIDVDGDGNTELVVISDDKYQISGQTPGCPLYQNGEKLRHGVFVYGDSNDKWVGSRKIWNQHAYHQTNVNADASIPVKEPASWGPSGDNTYRVSSQGKGVFNAADLALDLEISTVGCPTALTVKARLKNLGSQGVPAGVVVRFYAGKDANGELLLTAASTSPLLPGQSEIVSAAFTVAGKSPPYQFFAVVDDGGKIDECNEANNTATAGGIACPSKD